MLMSRKEGGNIVSYDKAVLSRTEHTVRLTPTYPEFKIRWQPFVFTYASKESKESKARSARLHALDIKTSMEFVFNKTTHVVSLKRNLPKVLQALVTATPIVTGDFLDAVLAVAAPQDADPVNFKPSKLEEDFDVWWPKEKEYMPPVGAEPHPRPAYLLEPDETRSELFSGLIFIFLDASQFNSLEAPISGGGGKAMLFNIRFGETTVDEYADYVRNTAGEKMRSKNNDSGRLPVITIRLSNYPDGMEQWATDFVTGVDQALNQRSIQQNEFLDAIVTKDISSLQRPPPEIEVPSSMPIPADESTPMQQSALEARTTRSRASSQAPETTPAQPEEPRKTNPRKRPIRRGITQSRFTGFDDYEPPAKVRKVEGNASLENVQKSMPVQDSYNPSQLRSVTTGQPSQRHESPIEGSVEKVNQLDQLFPATAMIKRQREATRGISASVEPDTPVEPNAKKSGGTGAENLLRPQKKVPKDVDIKEQTRLRVKEEEEKRRADEERLNEALEDVDISDIRKLVQIEEMHIVPRTDRPVQHAEGSGERWQAEWNGRKNFKKFRRRGTEGRPEAQKVIVTLEEAPPKKGFGLGDAFFLEEPEKTSQRRQKRLNGRVEDSDSEAETGFIRPTRAEESEVINVEDSGPDDEEVIPNSIATERSRTQRVAETQITDTQTQTQRGSRKRAPLTVAAGPSKRTKIGQRLDSSDEEETGFRFRRRGKDV
jgi:hypothetical protein